MANISSGGSFSIRVKPEVIQKQVEHAQGQVDAQRKTDITEVANQYGLSKEALDAGGVDINDAPAGLALDMFMKLSDNDTKITKADILKFKGNDTPDITEDSIVYAYAQQISESLPARQMDITPGDKQEMLVLSDLKKRGDEIIVAPRYATEGTSTGRDPAAAMVFSIVGGQDKNADGMIAVGGELSQNPVFSNTIGDAIKLSGSDMMVSPTEALQAILDKAGKISAEDLEIVYHAPQK